MKRLAIISPNQKAYSETFIRAQIQGLLNDVLLYSGGYRPQLVSHDRGENFVELPRFWAGKNDWKSRFVRSLKAEKIECALVQYGLTAVETMYVLEELKIPFVVHFHGFDAYREDVIRDYSRFYPEMFTRANAVIAVSRDMVRQLMSLGCPSNKLHYLPYGVDEQFFYPADSLGNYFLSCGRFVHKKGALFTLRAFAELVKKQPLAQLRMIGDGPQFLEAMQYIERSGLTNNVSLLGVKTPGEVAEEMRGAFCFVQHSITAEDGDSEGTPIAIIEASACGLPVIATRHAGIIDVVKEGESGILVQESAIGEMADAMEKMLLELDLAHRMGAKGRSIVMKGYTKREYLLKLMELINRNV